MTTCFPFLLHLEDPIVHQWVVTGILISSLPTYLALTYIPETWGKTLTTDSLLARFFPSISAPVAWCFFEIPNLYWSAYYWKAVSSQQQHILLSFFVLHYVQRSILYPLMLAKSTKRIPLPVVLAAFAFTNCNGYAQGYALSHTYIASGGNYRPFLFYLGLCLFFIGIFINLQSDAILRKLRHSGDGYQIPYGGMFRYVSTPHYFGEIVEWMGFCIACHMNAASVAFVIYTASNLVPRSRAHHHWYQTTFGDKYPRERKAIVPFLY
ncbi:3-oxo-5-alpha-steroid 4-dehydrogenase 1 [Fistulifera solaris]|uniref:3-oxo-5-alpha-steroid 4-dehydrogenase 1 n=1 Tax=Fistulifera solaris TaxID=1519565 RepID=A0A1Z5JFM0_FISSO|nr:3-oxo-5-alpha-steroid 4-dehydrogenase 1 [Fistulifera solaris]|eukprot:GAX12692.1 3-oxo-5-alpha-steroid 4-dehydrogenase 1 [Fistulifera solaris]